MECSTVSVLYGEYLLIGEYIPCMFFSPGTSNITGFSRIIHCFIVVLDMVISVIFNTFFLWLLVNLEAYLINVSYIVIEGQCLVLLRQGSDCHLNIFY